MKNPLRFLVPALIAMLSAPAVLQAGEPESETRLLTVGRKVRFIAPEIGPGLRTGRLVAEDAETLTVNVNGEPLRVRRDALTVLEVSRPTRRWKEGALVGGVALGGLLVMGGDGGPDTWIAPRDLAPAGALFGALTGAVLGAFIEDDRWQSMFPPRVSVSVGPVPGRGVGASLTLRF